jgi:hypothetical protein
MLGGGVFVTQNKVLPGSYVNFVNASAASSAIGDRGVVAIALPLSKAEGKVIELERAKFVTDCETILGKKYDSDEVAPLREIFAHANKVYLYDLGETKTVADAVNAFEAYDFNDNLDWFYKITVEEFLNLEDLNLKKIPFLTYYLKYFVNEGQMIEPEYFRYYDDAADCYTFYINPEVAR